MQTKKTIKNQRKPLQERLQDKPNLRKSHVLWTAKKSGDLTEVRKYFASNYYYLIESCWIDPDVVLEYLDIIRTENNIPDSIYITNQK